MSETFHIGQTSYHQQGREWVRVVVLCEHGDPAAPSEYITNHDEGERILPSQRAEVVDEAIARHRAGLARNYHIACQHRVPDDFVVRRDE
jgi:hypothetical protein